MKRVFIPLEAIDRIQKRGGSKILLAFFVTLKRIEHKYCTRQKDYFAYSDQQIRAELGICKQTITKLKRELVELGLAEIWQAKLPASKRGRGRKLRRTTPHITYYRLLY